MPTICPDPRQQTIALLYQAMPPPVIDGLRKDAKPGGYSDSGADIAFTLRQAGLRVATPVPEPDPANAMDWVFPDTEEGIDAALRLGATLLWANTVLFAGHPLERVLNRCWIVGQLPAAMQQVDDKFATNALLRGAGLPVAASLLAAHVARDGVHALADLTGEKLKALGLPFPLIVKPVRGRGSQGVTLVEDHAAFVRAADELVASGRFGTDVIIEQFLQGTEMTVTVMAGRPPWPLPPVARFNHDRGVAPYNGTVAVTHNSRALTPEEQAAPAVVAMLDACVAAAGMVAARAPIRIDCRADANGVLRLFDLNMKPNMTGAGRPGRDDQDSLSAIAARALGWRFEDLLLRMLDDAWRADTAERRKRLTFWGADENDDSLVRAVIAGRKTVTADTVEDYYKPYGEFGDGSYAAGDVIEVYDLKQRLRCLIRATKTQTIRFGAIPEEVWRGETFASAQEFRDIHIRCLPQYDLHDDFAFVTLHFELVEVIDQ